MECRRLFDMFVARLDHEPGAWLVTDHRRQVIWRSPQVLRWLGSTVPIVGREDQIAYMLPDSKRAVRDLVRRAVIEAPAVAHAVVRMHALGVDVPVEISIRAITCLQNQPGCDANSPCVLLLSRLRHL